LKCLLDQAECEQKQGKVLESKRLSEKLVQLERENKSLRGDLKKAKMSYASLRRTQERALRAYMKASVHSLKQIQGDSC
jgi:hypothetical protein